MSSAPSKYRILILFLVATGSVGAGLFGYEFLYRYRIWTLRAFRASSNSMCPAICAGQQIFVQMQVEAAYVPKRGDVIVFDYGSDSVKFIKRVVGVPGDFVAPGPENIILVNGKPLMGPAICSKSLLRPNTDGDGDQLPPFEAIRVPNGQVFVIGDNLKNSLDSRFKDFGPVTLDKIRGKPG